MFAVLGLGNPGSKYRDTRHNVGFRVADVLATSAGASFSTATGALGDLAWTAEARLDGEEVLLAKPRTFMNRSGRAAAELCRRHGIDVGHLVVVHDDADLELGRIRIRGEGGAGGHNGIRSLLDVLRDPGFPRVNLGVRGSAREERDLADYVLEPFAPDEREIVSAMVERGAEAVRALLREGTEAAMRRFNGAPGPSSPAA